MNDAAFSLKKRITALALVVLLLMLLLGRATLAYFTATDTQVNTFKYGDISVDIKENFNPDNKPVIPVVDKNGDSKLDPADANYIIKQAWGKNSGTNAAYMRMSIAVPAALYDAGQFWMDIDAAGWVMTASYHAYGVETNKGYKYTVLEYRYETAVAPGAETPQLLKGFALGPNVSKKNGTLWISDTNTGIAAAGSDTEGYVVVGLEAVQADGFADAATAIGVLPVHFWTQTA